MHKVETILNFETKRKRNLVTPCCNKTNKDGKFATYKGLADNYGYCHSCGTSSLPPTIYRDEIGNEFCWNNITKKFEPTVLQLSHKNVLQNCNTNVTQSNITTQYIDFGIVIRFLQNPKENNLLRYLRTQYNNESVDKAKEMYYIGTSKDRGIVFWNINSNKQTQKAKVSYFNSNGKRTNRFKAPYKNENGYYSCFFGEHLITDNSQKQIVLVESEKTAIVCSIELPKFTWLSYGGINGLTENKLKVLKGKNIIIVPDMSKNAVSIMTSKMTYLNEIGIKAEIWDMTNGMSDEELKEAGWYNCDLEDFFRAFKDNRAY
ncbi:hypothetical protein A9Q87_04550 [Flavobacteriales bacterium 34_180_T64]|nr:hypothetical protein A9Q87_04550 [Flavobacteriales bacterium 34_180_T64]